MQGELAMRTFFERLRQLFGRRRSTRAARPFSRSCRLLLEQLEDRTVPTVVFNSALGGDKIDWVQGNTAGHKDNEVVTSPITTNPTVLNNPTVYLIFWGKSWTNTNARPLANDARTILQSNFFSGLKDYGGDGLATYGDYTIDNSVAPPADTDPATKEVQKELPMTAWAKPQDSSPLDSPIYIVVTDTNGVKFGGWNGHRNYSASQVMNLIWIGDSGNNQDSFTYLFSHEVAERISDGTSTGIEMNAQVDAGTDGEWKGVQISDNEPDGGNYTYRLNGSLQVQAYWSLTYKAFVVPDGNTQTLYLTPNWNKVPTPPQFQKTSGLTISGDGTLTLDENGSGLSITLNGEHFSFDRGKINSITVNEGNGNDTVNVEGTVFGDPVTIYEGGGTDVVDVGPDLNKVPQLAVAGAGADAKLTVDDSADTKDGSYTIDGFKAVLSRNQQTVSSISYVVQGHTFGEIDLTAGQGTNQILVTGSSSATTSITAGTSNDVVTIGNGVIEKVAGTVLVDGHGGKLILDDHSAPAQFSQTTSTQIHTYTYVFAYTLTSQAQNQGPYNAVVRTDHIHEYQWLASQPPSAKAKHLPNPYIADYFVNQAFDYTNVGNLTIDGGQSNVTFNVQSTPQGTPVTINASSSGNQTIQIGYNGSVKGIDSALTLNGQGGNTTVLVDDSTSTTLDVLTIANGQSGDVQVGMEGGNKFFGANGGLDCSGIGSLTVNLSKAANDVVHLSPGTKTAFTINGDSSEYQAGFGVELDIVLGGMTDDVLTPGAPGAGTWGFSKGGHMPITFTNVKKTQAQ
jgi:hypothetical protein